MLMLLIETNVRKTYVIATRDVFRGLEGPVLFSLLKTAQNEVPIVPMMFLYEARARASYRSIIGTIGNPFWLNWGQEESKT